MRQVIQFSVPPFNNVLEMLAIAIRQDKAFKSVRTESEKMKYLKLIWLHFWKHKIINMKTIVILVKWQFNK